MRFVILVASFFVTLTSSQAQRPAFEVASLKPSAVVGPINTTPGRFIAVGQSLKALIGFAYRKRAYQIFGGPEWMSADRWEIQAKVPEGVVVSQPSTMEELEKSLTTPDAIALMLQSLLQDRFQLKIHHETRELPIYVLAVAPGSPKIIFSEDQTPLVFGGGGTPLERLPNGMPVLTRGSFSIRSRTDRRIMEGKAIPMSRIVNLLVNELGRPVVDKTNLKGLYDVRLEWAPENLRADPENGAPVAPMLTTALQEQLGLKLDSTKGPVEVIVVDGAQKPAEN